MPPPKPACCRPPKSRSSSFVASAEGTQGHYIGIDLGTTNSAIAFIEPSGAEDGAVPKVQIPPVLQPVAEGREEPMRTLPSFLYLSEPPIVGAFAREQGALTPTRL